MHAHTHTDTGAHIHTLSSSAEGEDNQLCSLSKLHRIALQVITSVGLAGTPAEFQMAFFAVAVLLHTESQGTDHRYYFLF